jgi:hypothetical protein
VGAWRKQKFASTGAVTEYPAGPNLAALAVFGAQKIQVTAPNFDDIGQVLDAMGVGFDPFAGDYDCDLLFANCGSADCLDPTRLRAFVERGGCLYASDLTSSLVAQAFPGCFRFSGGGSAGKVRAAVVDQELRQVIGPEVGITFDMAAWSVLDWTSGATLVQAAAGQPQAGKPLMVEVDFGGGAVFYTCFHNRAQTSKKEAVLLKLLVLKQMGAATNRSVTQVSQSLGLDRLTLKKL